MPRLRGTAATRSERACANRQARGGDIARRAMSRGRCRERGEQRRWRVSAELVARRWRTASRRRAARRAQAGAERSDAPRGADPRRREEPPAMGAERSSHGGGETRDFMPAPASAARSDRRERRRQGSSPEGRRPRSGLRGAGRGEAAPGGIEPGDRSEGPGGRPYFPVRAADDKGPSSTTVEDYGQAKGIQNSPNGAPSDRLVAALDAVTERAGEGEVAGGGARSAAAMSRPQDGEPTRRGWKDGG